jgi:hypothetical protein
MSGSWMTGYKAGVDAIFEESGTTPPGHVVAFGALMAALMSKGVLTAHEKEFVSQLWAEADARLEIQENTKTLIE